MLPVQCCSFSGRWVRLVGLSHPLPLALKTENSELSLSKARARFAPINSKIERALNRTNSAGGWQSTQANYANGLNGCFSAALRLMGWVECCFIGIPRDLYGVLTPS